MSQASASSLVDIQEPDLNEYISPNELEALQNKYKIRVCQWCGLTRTKVCLNFDFAGKRLCPKIWDFDKDTIKKYSSLNGLDTEGVGKDNIIEMEKFAVNSRF